MLYTDCIHSIHARRTFWRTFIPVHWKRWSFILVHEHICKTRMTLQEQTAYKNKLPINHDAQEGKEEQPPSSEVCTSPTKRQPPSQCRAERARSRTRATDTTRATKILFRQWKWQWAYHTLATTCGNRIPLLTNGCPVPIRMVWEGRDDCEDTNMGWALMFIKQLPHDRKCPGRCAILCPKQHWLWWHPKITYGCARQGAHNWIGRFICNLIADCVENGFGLHNTMWHVNAHLVEPYHDIVTASAVSGAQQRMKPKTLRIVNREPWTGRKAILARNEHGPMPDLLGAFTF